MLSVAVAFGVCLGAACGPVALWLAVTNSERAVTTAAVEQPDVRGGLVGPFAALFVAGWLRGDDVTFFNPGLAAVDTGLLVDRSGPARVTDRGQGVFEVIVATDLVEFVEGSEEQYRALGLRFYAVGVAADDADNLVVLGPPAVVEAPEPAVAPTPYVVDLAPPTSPAVAAPLETLTGFFAAYLTGTGDVDLFTAPRSTVAAVTPAPFGRVDIRAFGWTDVPGIDDDRLRLTRIQLDAHGVTGSQRLEYSVVLAERDDRWEVSQVLNAPIVTTAPG
jgi:hypothetical protein